MMDLQQDPQVPQQGLQQAGSWFDTIAGLNTAPTAGAIQQPTSDQNPSPNAGGGPAVPSYINLSDPTQKLVWDGFASKGITPRDQNDFQYWVDHVNQSGGTADAGNASYWTNRLAQSQGGAGDYQERPEQGASGTMGAPAALPPAYQVPTYTPPTLDQIRATPGYQFAQEQGDEGIQRRAAAKGTLLSGGTLKDLATYNQGLADTASQQATTNSLNAFGANTAAGQFGANYGLAANQQGFGQNLATNQFNLGQQGQFWGQGLAENQNAFNQYNTNTNTAFGQWLAKQNLALGASNSIYG